MQNISTQCFFLAPGWSYSFGVWLSSLVLASMILMSLCQFYALKKNNLLSFTNVCRTYILNTKRIWTICISGKVWDDWIWKIVIDCRNTTNKIRLNIWKILKSKKRMEKVYYSNDDRNLPSLIHISDWVLVPRYVLTCTEL